MTGMPRKPLTWEFIGRTFYVRFRHPLWTDRPRAERSVRVKLGTEQADADAKVAELNKIFLHPDQWQNPVLANEWARNVWGGQQTATQILKQAVEVAVVGTVPYDDQDPVGVEWAGAVVLEDTRLIDLQTQLENERAARKSLEKMLNRKARLGACPTLAKAKDDWLAAYKGRDADWARIVAGVLNRFVREHNPLTPVDNIDERTVEVWLNGLEKLDHKLKPTGVPVSAKWRLECKKIVLRWLRENNVPLDGDKITIKTQVHRVIRALTAAQRDSVTLALHGYWRDLFRVQCAIGLRPDELITVKREDISEDWKYLTLSPLGALTLKSGSRRILLPMVVKAILKRRLAESAIAFPNPKTGAAWANPKEYNRLYRKALKKAGAAAGIPFKMDCRIGRRTCATLLLAARESAERVAALLGNSAKMVLEHYGKVESDNVDTEIIAERVSA